MVALYALLVTKGLKTIDDVPDRLKDEVLSLLTDEE